MPPSKVLDSHIHLWPSTATTPTNHSWMTTPSHPLAKRHGIADYHLATRSSAQPTPFVYVETDRYLPSPSPPIPPSEEGGSDEEIRGVLREWAAEPLNELRFLRRIVEGVPEEESDGFAAADGREMVGIVAWTPLHLSPRLFQIYLRLAKGVAGQETWERVVGFRYLLQGITEEEAFRKVVESEAWLENLVSLDKGREGEGWSFDVGVDTRSGGVWQVERAAEMVERVRGMGGETRFILNHFCKPDLSTPSLAPSAERWKSAISKLATFPSVYIKFSGAFAEFGGSAPWPADAVLEHLSFYASHALQVFGPGRIMFGSDWPVCNVFGPKGEESCGAWREVLANWLETQGISGEEAESIWWRTGAEAYGVAI